MQVYANNTRPGAKTNVMNTMYWLTDIQVHNLIKELLTGTFLTNFAKLFSDPSENIISLMQYPFDICKACGRTPEIEPIEIGIVDMQAEAMYSTQSVVVAKIFYNGLQVEPKYNSFLDYAPYTDVSIYIPFAGFVDLETNIVMGKKLNVEYVVSLVDGTSTVSISTTQDGIIKTLNCVVGVNTAIGGGTMNNVAKSIMGGIVDMGMNMLSMKVGSGFSTSPSGYTITNTKVSKTQRVTTKTYNAPTITKNPPASPMESLRDSVKSLKTVCNTQYKINRGNTQGNYNQYWMPLRPVLFITRPKSFYPDDYNHLVGRPSGKSMELGDLKGYTSMDAMHVEGFANATQGERDSIANSLQSGVILGYEFAKDSRYRLNLDADAVSTPMEIRLPFRLGDTYYDTIVINQYGELYYENRQDPSIPHNVIFSQGEFVSPDFVFIISERFTISNNELNSEEYQWLINHTTRIM